MTHARWPQLFLAAAVALSGCSQTSGALPQATIVDPVATSKLQLAVGVATISSQGNVGTGLNVVETLRQSDGLSGTLFNVPVLTGPATFTISQATISSSISPPIQTLARADLGTNRISQQTLDTQQATGYIQNQPFATSGAFGYGLCACNANAAPLSGTPQLFQSYNLPFYAVLPFGNFAGNQFLSGLQYYGAPPAFPAPPAGASGFIGYPIGFTDFAVAPVAGAYRLDVALPPSFTTSVNASTPTLSATATLQSTQGLPAFATPSFASDGAGGGTIFVSAPAGVTESMVFVQEGSSSPYCADNRTQPTYFTFLLSGSGTQTVTVPDASLCKGAPYFIYAAGFDYPAYEAAYPQSTAQTPAITGANGQADVTTSDALAGTY